MACPDIDALLGYAEATLAATERDAVEEHIDACGQCRALVVHAVRERVSGSSPATGAWSSVTPSASMPLPMSLSLPARVGRYMIVDRIGIGGMGVVCSAFDPRLHRVVAVKLVRRDRNDREGAARLRREAQALARLAHPNVVTVFECGALEDNAGIYLVMEMVEGDTLRRWCERRSPAEILAAYLDAAAGLSAAHAVGIVHRDFKPDNVLIDHATGRVRVGDFGLARALATTTQRTPVGSANDDGASDVAGTPAYMAPEQADGREADPAADQYAFCVSLWEALAGALPPGGDRRRIPSHVRVVLLRGMRTAARDRWPSIDALTTALRRRNNWRFVVVGGALATVVAALGIAEDAGGASDDACTVARHAIDSVWDDERRIAIAALDHSSDIVPRIEDWTARWHAEADAACVGDPTPLHAGGCLALAVVEFDTILGVLERDAEITPASRGAVLDFAGIDACRDSSAGQHALPDATRAASVQTQLAQADALLAMHRYDGARSLSAAAVVDAEALGDPLLAVALQQHSAVLHAAADFAAEAAVAERAFHVASTAGLDDIAASVATRRVFTTSRIDRDFASATNWARHAESAIERMPPAARALPMARLAGARGHIAQGQGRNDEAAQLFAAAIDGLQARENIGASELAAAHNDYGTSLMPGNPDAALVSFERALEILRLHYGGLHQRIAMMLSNIAGIHYRREDYVTAERYFSDAATMLTELLGENHHDVAGAHMNLGLAQDHRGDPTSARASIEKAIRIFSQSLGPDHPEVGIARVNLGAIDLGAGDVDAAQAQFQAAMTSFEISLGPEHTYCTNALRGLAEVELIRGRPARAAVLQRRALEIDRKDKLDVLILAQGHLEVAVALHQAGDGAAAEQMVRDAITAIEGDAVAHEDAGRAQLDELRAWLREHPS